MDQKGHIMDQKGLKICKGKYRVFFPQRNFSQQNWGVTPSLMETSCQVQGVSKKTSFCQNWPWQILLLTVRNPYETFANTSKTPSPSLTTSKCVSTYDEFVPNCFVVFSSSMSYSFAQNKDASKAAIQSASVILSFNIVPQKEGYQELYAWAPGRFFCPISRCKGPK